MVEGLISFVYGTIKKRRRERRATEYNRLSSGGAPSTQWRSERYITSPTAYGGGGRSQSCRFVERPPADDFDLSHGERSLQLGGRATQEEGLPENERRLSRRFSSLRLFGFGRLPEKEPFPPAGDGRRLSSRSRRFSSLRLFG
nr:unnamed protein product [Digitaria exilis]